MAKKISEKGLALIKEFEGCRLTAYKPVAAEKYWTIGWGHYGPDVFKGMTITQQQADALLKADMIDYENYVNNKSLCPVSDALNQNQFDALVSFTYNCGSGSLQQLCRNRTIAEIANHITSYVNGASGPLEGLRRRRKAELALYLSPISKAEETSVKEPDTNVGGISMYKTLGDVPEWSKKDIEPLVDRGYIADKNSLNFSEEGIRILSIVGRVLKDVEKK